MILKFILMPPKLGIVFRACLNFLQKVFYSASFELLSGLFSSFFRHIARYDPHKKQENILKKNSKKKAEQNLNRLLVKIGWKISKNPECTIR